MHIVYVYVYVYTIRAMLGHSQRWSAEQGRHLIPQNLQNLGQGVKWSLA